MSSLLIVEDDEELLAILQRWFTRRGLTVVACGNIETALSEVSQHAFNAAIVDGILHGRDGVGLVRQLQALNQQMHIIMLSGRATPDAIELARQAGVFEYLCKPCGLVELEAAVERATELSISSVSTSALHRVH